MERSNLGEALLCGAMGAAALTTVHQLAQRATDDAPRMDVVGMRALARGLESRGTPIAEGEQLYRATLAGELVSNTLYYALVPLGRGRDVWTRGAALGLAAGIAALLLPRRMGLGDPPRSDRAANQIMTVAWYLIGGLSAAATAVCLRETRDRAHEAAALQLP